MAKYIGWPLILLSAYAALCFLASRSVYYPFKFPQGDWHLQSAIGAEDVWMQTEDGVRLHGWWITRADAAFATLHLHGNGGNVTHRAALAPEILRAGSSLLLLDYRGYGRSEGRPTERGLYRDADAAYDFLIARGVDPKRLIVHGESLGSAVAVDLAIRKPCAGLVLEAPFPSARDVAARVLPFIGRWLIWGFDSTSKIGKLRTPLLVIHGNSDEVIDFELGGKLFAAAPEPKLFWTVEGAGHNDLLRTAGSQYAATLANFYRSLPRLQSRP